MYTRFGYSVILFAFILSSSSFAGLYKEDKCSLKNGGQGICMLIKECPTAVQLIKEGIYPVICGFEGTESIVCCKDDEETTSTTSTTTTTTNPRITSRTKGDISIQKCKEYAEYAYEKIPAPTLLLDPHFTKKFVCDIPNNRLIVGSVYATRREFPHMALIGFKYNDDDKVSWLCGGSLISENFVLTTAHCVYARILGPAKLVRFGLINQTDLTHMQERTVSEAIAHPKYRYPSRYHDIGLLRLSENVKFNTYVRPACLYTPEQYMPYELAIASPWGTLQFAGEDNDNLLDLVLELFSVDKCNSTYNSTKGLKDGIVDDLMICAGNSKSPRIIVCQGGSGGPLQVYHGADKDNKCMYDIIGVTSFGKSCGLTKDNPAVHTRVSHYIKWIEDTVWPN